jgi:hypothetical protein
MRNFSSQIIEKIKTQMLCPVPSETPTLYEIIWKKNGSARQAIYGNIMQRMRFACWINRATDTYSEYVTTNSKNITAKAPYVTLYVH